MMIIMQFTFQIILLAIGFGVGYWLLITANTQQGSLKTVGQSLGGILVVMAMFLAILSCYYSMKIANKGYMQGGCPVQNMMQQQENPAMENEVDENDEAPKGSDNSGIQQNQTRPLINPNKQNSMQENAIENESKPIKSNIKDHE